MMVVDGNPLLPVAEFLRCVNVSWASRRKRREETILPVHDDLCKAAGSVLPVAREEFVELGVLLKSHISNAA